MAENTYQLKKNDWVGSSMIVIDGVHFAICGFDDHSEYSQKDLEEGLQERIHRAILRVAEALSFEIESQDKKYMDKLCHK